MQVQNLEKEIITLRVQNRYAALQLQNVQSEIEHFTTQYYSALEDICIQLADIESKVKRYDQKMQAVGEKVLEVAQPEHGYGMIQPRDEPQNLFSGERILPVTKKEEQASLEIELKNLYRGLIKMVHPDVSEEKLMAADYTMMVNKAYNERNYRQLVELDHMIRAGNASDAELKQQRNKLVDATFDLKTQREDLLQNPLYLLSEEFAEAEDGGVEMIREVRAKLLEKVAVRKRDLREKKLAYLEKVSSLIVAA